MKYKKLNKQSTTLDDELLDVERSQSVPDSYDDSYNDESHKYSMFYAYSVCIILAVIRILNQWTFFILSQQYASSASFNSVVQILSAEDIFHPGHVYLEENNYTEILATCNNL